jgi:phospholipid-binding lipoprotein MlaA
MFVAHPVSQRILSVTAALLLCISLSACATVPSNPEERADYNQTNDMVEPLNRVVFDINMFLDKLIIRPAAEIYRYTVPPFFRDRIAGILSNMKEPVIFANNILQGELTRAATTAGRFVVNTTAGIGGAFDVAEDHVGWRQQNGDFGQTLHVWGMGEGTYLVLPFFGPSTIRDAIGQGVDMVMSPWQYIVALGPRSTERRYMISNTAANALSRREANIEALDNLEKGSIDFYAQMRSVYRQYRNKQLGAGMVGAKFEDEYGDTEPGRNSTEGLSPL